jgi:hypothetical protein
VFNNMAMRVFGAVAALVSAAVHLDLWFDGVRDQDKIGPLFMVNAVAGAAIAVLLVTWKHWVPLFVLFGFGASTLGAFLISWQYGLFGIHTSWDGWDEYTAAAAEIVAMLAALGAAYAEGWFASLRQSEHRVPGVGAHLH